MKLYLTIIILQLALISSSFNRALILLDYHVNREYIAAVLCVNKSNPVSCCRGKCYLNKKMAAQENRDKRGITKEKFENDWVCEDLIIENPVETKKINQVSRQSRLLSQPAPSLFHPPGL